MLSPDALSRIDAAIARYPAGQKQSAVMAALTIAQEEHGYLSSETLDFVAEYLGMAPVGKHKLCICTNLPCALAGANDAAAHLKSKLGIDWNDTTADRCFTLKQGECFGACGDAPVILHNNKRMLIEMSPEKLDRLIAELSQ